MRATIYLGRKELRNYLEARGYKIITLRKILTTEYGYSNSKKILEEHPNLTECSLNVTLAYKNQEEYRNITQAISYILDYLKSDDRRRLYGRDVIYISRYSTIYDIGIGYRTGNRSEMLYYYTESVAFRREFIEEVNEKIGLNEIRMSI